MRVKPAGKRDFLEIAKLDARAWGRESGIIRDGEHTWKIWCDYATVLTVWVKKSGRRKLGGVLLAFPTRQKMDVLHKIFVASSERGKGVGQLLMQAYLQSNPKRVMLTVSPANKRALPLYRKMGFRKWKFVKGYYRAREDRFLLLRQR